MRCQCGEWIVESFLGIEADKLLHRFFKHGTDGERFARWVFSLGLGVVISRAVPRILKELGST